jgi:hypothetical protein
MTIFDAVKNTFRLWWDALASVLPFGLFLGLFYAIILQNSIRHFVTLSELSNGIIMFVAAITSIIFINIIFIMLWHTKQHQPHLFSQALKEGVTKFLTILLWYIFIIGTLFLVTALLLFLLPTGLAFILSAIPVFTAHIYLQCGLPLMLIENESPISAIQKSFALVKNHFWFGAGLMLIINLCSGLIQAFLSLLGIAGDIISVGLILPLELSMIAVFYSYLKSLKSP